VFLVFYKQFFHEVGQQVEQAGGVGAFGPGYGGGMGSDMMMGGMGGMMRQSSPRAGAGKKKTP